MTTTDMDLMALLRAVDPINPEAGDELDLRLTGVWRLIDARRVPAPPVHDTRPSHHHWRAVAVLAAAAVLSPLAVVTLVPGMAARIGMPWIAIIGPEVADRLSCDGGGHATPIPPRDAALRLWPGELPPGWTVQAVFARRTEGSRGCSHTLPDGGRDRGRRRRDWHRAGRGTTASDLHARGPRPRSGPSRRPPRV